MVDTICVWRYTPCVATVFYHPAFARRYEWLCQQAALQDIAGEVSQLLSALEEYGHEIEGEADEDPSHPVVTAKVQMFALRRTPPTGVTPYADGPPVLRIPYVWFFGNDGEVAVVMMIDDKTELGNRWYPHAVARIEGELIPSWVQSHPEHRPIRRS